VGVEAPVHAVRRTGFSGEIRGGGAGVNVNGVVRARHLAYGEPHGRIGNVEDEVDAVGLDPLPRDVGADVRLVLVVGEGEFERPAKHLAALLMDRHASGVARATTSPRPDSHRAVTIDRRSGSGTPSPFSAANAPTGDVRNERSRTSSATTKSAYLRTFYLSVNVSFLTIDHHS